MDAEKLHDAHNSLDAAKDVLSDAFKSLRYAGRSDLANELVPMMTRVGRIMAEVRPAMETIHAGHSPTEWYLRS